MVESSNFRRVILGLHHDAPAHGLRVAAEVAALLRAQLCGLFIQGDELSGLAGLPFVREFRPLGGGWRSIDQGELSRELEAAASRAQRSFAEAVKGLDLSYRFDVVRGPFSETIASDSRAGDIIVVYEPASAADQVTVQFQSVIRAALGSASAVMLVPQRVVRQTGAVVALAKDPCDPSIAAAGAIAQLAGEELIIVEAFRGASDVSATTAAPTHAKRVSAPDIQIHSAGIPAAFTRLHERLIILTRGVFDDPWAAMISSIRHVPVLIVETAVDGSRAESSP
jgi:hypothetical protein